jgi:uncharacterized protein YdgA (DUF945 family)
MNKLTLAAAAVLAIVLLALPRIVGSMTEARVRERVAAIDASPAAAATVQSFDRGWFTSTAKIDLMLVPDAAAAVAADGAIPGNPFLGGAPLPIEIQFAHGPVTVLGGVHFGWSKMIARADPTVAGIGELQQTLSVPYLFEFRGRTSYGGTLAFDADAPAFALPIDEALLTFSGATLAGTFAGRRLDADANLGALEFASPTGTFAVSDVWASADNELRSDYVMPGKTTLQIGKVSIIDALGGTAPTFEAANLLIASDTTLHAAEALLDLTVSYDLAALRVDENELTGATLGFALRNVDVAALEAYGAAMRDAAATAGDPAVAITMLGPQLERALQSGPTVTLDPIRFRFDNEPFEGRVELTTNISRLPPAGALNLENPLQVLGLFDSTAAARTSKPLALQLATLVAKMQLGSDPSLPPDQVAYMAEAQAGLMLTLLTAQGVLVDDGNGYSTEIGFVDGELTLNGNALPFGLP